MDHPALRVGLLGFGYASQTFHAPLIQATPGLSLVAVSSSSTAKVHGALGPQIEVYPQAEDLIARAEVDIVVVPTPNDTHHALARTALLAGRHVVVDKPFTLDTAQAQDLAGLAHTQQRVLSVFHNRRWDGDFMAVRELLAKNTLGSLRHASLHFDRFRPQVRERWRESDVPGGGLWMDLGPHLLDQALQLFGWPVGLQADIATLRPGGRADDHFQACLRYADGLRVNLRASMMTAASGPRFELHGTLGSYRKWGLDPQEDALKAGLRPDPTAPESWGHDAQHGEWTVAEGDTLMTRPWPNQPGDYCAFYRGLRDAVWGQQPNPVPAWQAVQVMQLLDLGRHSAQKRRELEVPAAVAEAAS